MDNDLRWKLIIAGVVGGACAIFTAGLVLGILVCRKTMKRRKLAKERIARQLQTNSPLRGEHHRRTSSPMLSSSLHFPSTGCGYTLQVAQNLLGYPDIPIRPGSFRAMPSDGHGGHTESFIKKDRSSFIQPVMLEREPACVGTVQSSEQSTTSGSSEFTESISHSDVVRSKNMPFFPSAFDDHHPNTNILLHSEFSLHSGEHTRKTNSVTQSKHPAQYRSPTIQNKNNSGWPIIRPQNSTVSSDNNWSNSTDLINCSESDPLKHLRQHRAERDFEAPGDSGRGSWTDMGIFNGTSQSRANHGVAMDLDQRCDWLQSRFQSNTDSNRNKYESSEKHVKDWKPTSVEEVWLPRIDLEQPGLRDNFKYTPHGLRSGTVR